MKTWLSKGSPEGDSIPNLPGDLKHVWFANPVESGELYFQLYQKYDEQYLFYSSTAEHENRFCGCFAQYYPAHVKHHATVRTQTFTFLLLICGLTLNCWNSLNLFLFNNSDFHINSPFDIGDASTYQQGSAKCSPRFPANSLLTCRMCDTDHVMVTTLLTLLGLGPNNLSQLSMGHRKILRPSSLRLFQNIHDTVSFAWSKALLTILTVR